MARETFFSKRTQIGLLIVLATGLTVAGLKFFIFPGDNIVVIDRSGLKNGNQDSSLADSEAAEAALFAVLASRYFRVNDHWSISPLERQDSPRSDGDQVLLRNTLDPNSGIVSLIERKSGRRLVLSVTVARDTSQLNCRAKVPH